jgi:DNA-binding MarR family transcriptional regulator
MTHAPDDSAEMLRALQDLRIGLEIVTERVAKASRLNPRDLGVLDVLHTAGPATPSTIASRTGIAPTTVAAILTRLERDGRIDRRPNPEDARSSLLAIADDTGRELTRLYEGLNNEFARTITALTTAERTTITGFLQDLSTTIHRFPHFGPVRQGSARSEAGEGDSASRA